MIKDSEGDWKVEYVHHANMVEYHLSEHNGTTWHSQASGFGTDLEDARNKARRRWLADYGDGTLMDPDARSLTWRMPGVVYKKESEWHEMAREAANALGLILLGLVVMILLALVMAR